MGEGRGREGGGKREGRGREEGEGRGRKGREEGGKREGADWRWEEGGSVFQSPTERRQAESGKLRNN